MTLSNLCNRDGCRYFHSADEPCPRYLAGTSDDIPTWVLLLVAVILTALVILMAIAIIDSSHSQPTPLVPSKAVPATATPATTAPPTASYRGR